MLTFEFLGQNIAPLYFKTERVGKTALRSSWFGPTLGQFAGTWGIFSSLRDSKLGADGRGVKQNGHSKTFWTLNFELLDRNIALLHFKTERLAEAAFHAYWFWAILARFPRTWRIFSCPRDVKLTHGVGLQLNGQRKTFWTLTFELMGRNIAPFYFKT